MTLNQLMAFKLVAEEKSIRRASEKYFTTPQNMSKEIKALEDDLQTTLFTRSRTGMELTENGAKAYERILPILVDLKAFRDTFVPYENTSETDSCPVSIVITPVLNTYIASAIRALYMDFPCAIITDSQMSNRAIRDKLLSPEGPAEDIVLANLVPECVGMISSSTRKQYNCYKLYTDEMCLQIPNDSEYAAYEKIPLKLLSNMPLLVFSIDKKGESQLGQKLREKGIRLNNVSYTSNLETCCKTALMSNRMCFVAYPSVEFRPQPYVKYIPLEEGIYTYTLLLVRKNAKNQRYAKALKDYMDQGFDMKKLF